MCLKYKRQRKFLNFSHDTYIKIYVNVCRRGGESERRINFESLTKHKYGVKTTHMKCQLPGPPYNTHNIGFPE